MKHQKICSKALFYIKLSQNNLQQPKMFLQFYSIFYSNCLPYCGKKKKPYYLTDKVTNYR